MNRLATIGLALTGVVVTIGGVLVVTGGQADAAPVCGVWTRTTSTNPDNDGMQVRLVDDTAIVVDPAGSRFPTGTELWRSIDETEDVATLDVLGSDGRYYPAALARPDETTIQLTIDAGGIGTDQTWTTTSRLGCRDLALADVACGSWERTSSDNPDFDGMQVHVAGDRAFVTHPAESRYSLGDVLWRAVTPDGDGAVLEVRGSDGEYYPAALAALDADTLLLTIEAGGIGTEQTWARLTADGCSGSAPAEVACGTWQRSSSTDERLDGTEIRIAGSSAIVTEPAPDTWLHEGDVVWREIVDTGGGGSTLDLQVLGSNGSYYPATLSVLGPDLLQLEVSTAGAGSEQTWSRVNDVGCGTAPELACGVWERTGSSNPDNDGMRIRVTGSAAKVTDQAGSPYAVGDVLWRGIERDGDTVRLEVRSEDGEYYPGVLTAEGADGLVLRIEASGTGTEQSWTEVDASGCVADLGPGGTVCGTWTRTSSTNPAFDGMTVVVDGEQARVEDPADSRYPSGVVLWRYITAHADPIGLEVRGTDGAYYAAEMAPRSIDELALTILTGGTGTEQTWVRTTATGCDPTGDGEDDAPGGTVDVCGTWERTASTNPDSDGMQVVGAVDRALVTEPADSPFATGDVLWRDLTATPPTTSLEVRSTDGDYFPAELRSDGLERLELDIAVAGTGTEQTWESVDTDGCEEDGTTDVVCGTWTRTSSTNPDLDGTTVDVAAGRGTVTSLPDGAGGFAVGDVLWRDVTPGVSGWTLEVLGSDGRYHPARVLLAGVDTAVLSIDAVGEGLEQVWSLTTPGSCGVPELSVCGTWTREESTNPELDGTTITVGGREATITSLPTTASTFAVGDVVWREITATTTGTTAEVLGSDGAYHPGTITPRGVDVLELVVDASGVGTTQTWVETSTDGCDLVGLGEGAAPGPSERPTDTPPDPTPSDPATADEGTRECVPGTWRLDSPSFVDELMAASGGVPPGGTVTHTGGTYDLTIRGDGSYVMTRDDWTLSLGSPDGTIEFVFDGQQRGTMTWDATTIEADETANETVVQPYAVAGGERVPLPTGPGLGPVVDTETIDGSGTYVCDDDTLRIDIAGGPSPVRTTWTRLSGP